MNPFQSKKTMETIWAKLGSMDSFGKSTGNPGPVASSFPEKRSLGTV